MAIARVVAVGAAAVLTLVGIDALRSARPKKVFVSYDHSEDVQYKSMMRAWDANPKFEFTFNERSPLRAIDSRSERRVKAALLQMLRSADYLLVIVGPKTSKSRYVQWEIEQACRPDVNLRIAAVKLRRAFPPPKGLLGIGTAWATGFERDRIVAALDRANSARLPTRTPRVPGPRSSTGRSVKRRR